MPPPSQYQNSQAAQQLLRGMNTMQMRQGLMPGGVAQMPPMITPPQMGPRPADISRNLQVQFWQRQQLAQMVAPPPIVGRGMSPIRRPSPFEQGMMFPSPNLPGPQFGRGRMMARQQARSQVNERLGMAQGGLGLGMRAMGTGGAALAGGALGGMMLGPSGALMGGAMGAGAFEHFGGGQAMQNFGAGMMQPMIRNRMQAMTLQNQSMGFVRGGQDMSSSGTGLSMAASTRLSSQLNTMAGSSSFQKDTGGRFNKQDVMKITRLAGEMGMMEQSQTADQIKDSIGKISRSLANFMKIAEEPDVQEAMKMMGQMRSMGMSLGQTSAAASNARQFARMAGTSVRGVMQGGMQGAGQFQQAGMTGASGLNAGMAAQGMAGQMAGFMNPAQLAMAGGRSGIASTISGQAARAGTMDALMPAMLTRRNGRLAIDQEQIMRMATGEMNIQEAMRQGGGNIRRLGGRRAIQELSTRRRELQDEAQQGMGGQMSALMPLIQARMIMQSTPGMNMGGALRIQGMNEQQARTFEQMVQNPQFWQNMREQQRVGLREARNDLAERREQTRSDAATPRALVRLEHSYNRLTQRGSSAMGRAEEFFARRQDVAEDQETAGGGRRIGTLHRSRLDSDTQRASIRDLSRTREGRTTLREGQNAAAAATDRGVAAERDTDAGIASMRGRFLGLGTIAAEIAEAGVEEYRHAESEREVVNRGQGLTTRVSRFFGTEIPTSRQIQREAQGQRATGRRFERVNTDTNRQRDRTFARARRATSASGSEEDSSRMIALAATAINQYADAQTTLGVTHGAVTEEGQREAVRARLSASGFNAEQIRSAMGSEDFMQQAVHTGAGSRSESAQASIDAAVEQGGQAEAVSRNRRERVTREQADTARESALEGLGVGTGFFSSTSEEQQRAVLSVLSGQGRDADLRREALSVRALQRRAALNPDDTDLQDQANAAADNLQEAAGGREAANVALAAVSAVDDSTLVQIGESLEGKTPEEVAEIMASRGAEATQAGIEETQQQLERNLGEEGAAALRTGGAAGLQAFLETGGGRMGTSARERMIRQIRSGDLTEDDIRERAARETSGEGGSTFAGGLSQLAERAGMEGLSDVFASLEDFATQGGEGPGGVVAEPRTFEEAVGVFSEASANLLAASNQMSTGGDLLGLQSVVNAGSPLANMALAPVAGPLSLLSQGFSAIFGAGRD